MKVLYVEDEAKVAGFVRDALEAEEYAVELASDGERGYDLAQSGDFDLIILDILLPKKDGLAILKDLRRQNITTPILLLTAKSSLEAKVEGFDSGADQYLTKPFAVTELLARVRSLIRRRNVAFTAFPRLGDLVLNTVTRKASRQGKEIELTSKEYALLEFFMRNKNKTLSRTSISEHIWGYNFDTGTNIIDVYLSHLRNKIDGPFEKKLFHTIRGVGYVLKEE